MDRRLASLDRSVLLLIDLQPTFMRPMPDGPTVVRRARFLTEVATLLQVPILVTEQYPARMGGTDPGIAEVLPGATKPIPKMTFSACGESAFMLQLDGTGRSQVILTGCETHICVAQTALDLIARGFQVILAADAITGRGEEARKSSLRRMASAGAIESHTESITYEWLHTAEHPKFKDILGLVKTYAAG